MDLNYFVQRFSQNRDVFQSLLRGVSTEQAVWKPAPDKWSMLEVVNHLYDEEREDFRQRLELTLRDPAEEWPRIDPQGWVESRKYSERELGASLDNFLSEREKSLSWLKDLPGRRSGKTVINAKPEPCPQATCWLHGWPMTFCIYAS